MCLTAQEGVVWVTFWFDLQEGLMGIEQECYNSSDHLGKAQHCNSRKQLLVNHLSLVASGSMSRTSPISSPQGETLTRHTRALLKGTEMGAPGQCPIPRAGGKEVR